MIKALLPILLTFSLANAYDGYVRLSDLDAKTMQENSFVSLDTLEENSEWVSLTSLEEDSFQAINSDLQVIANLDLEDEYIALDIYDTQIETTQENDEYVSLDEMQRIEEYDIVAVYEDMMKEEEQAILSMNFQF